MSGATQNGIIRKRQADLMVDLANLIKINGAFGPQTTLDNPDQYPTDPLVQIGVATTSSLHELWEGLEYLGAQMDPQTAEGDYFVALHGDRIGITQSPNQTFEQYREQVLDFLASGKTKSHPEAIAMSQEGIDCAKLIKSTTKNPIAGIPPCSAMLVIKGCNPDYAQLATDLAEKGDCFGAYDLYGDIDVVYSAPNGDCIPYSFQPACRIFMALNVTGYQSNDLCETISTTDAAVQIVDRLKAAYANCGFGHKINEAELLANIGKIDGYTITSIGIQRRAPALFLQQCDPVGSVMVEVCDEIIPWTSNRVCGYCQGEMWCYDYTQCLELMPWEFPDFDVQFVTMVKDVSAGGCL